MVMKGLTLSLLLFLPLLLLEQIIIIIIIIITTTIKERLSPLDYQESDNLLRNFKNYYRSRY